MFSRWNILTKEISDWLICYHKSTNEKLCNNYQLQLYTTNPIHYKQTTTIIGKCRWSIHLQHADPRWMELKLVFFIILSYKVFNE